ncbi:AraC family transcriptional regulator with amidase-like domain [Martelella mediterranea]|uniref:AraC family transcriptional regulator with amidase-like domain n=2 Tax=Martelella mediterranea TaxID=293089 RepID=A0A4R3P1M8_9HYPH|nr:AraC family transcriptional regulator with amidase-like domain [Martelella mediterranea]
MTDSGGRTDEEEKQVWCAQIGQRAHHNTQQIDVFLLRCSKRNIRNTSLVYCQFGNTCDLDGPKSGTKLPKCRNTLFPDAIVYVSVVNRQLAYRFLEEIKFSVFGYGFNLGGACAMVRSFVFYLIPGFSLLPFVGAIESLRIANRMLGIDAYRWRVASDFGGKVFSSSGIAIESESSLTEERRALMGENRPDLVFICSGVNVEDYDNKSFNAWLRELNNRGCGIGSMCTAAELLARAGLLKGKRCAIHWENLPGFSETWPEIDAHADLFEVDRNIYTSAGGTASLDIMLWLIGREFGDGLVSAICEQALTDRVRPSSERQRLPLKARLGVQNGKVLQIIELMEANLAEPLSLIEIAGAVGLSRRQIERLFRQEMGRSPARYYLEIRLDRARRLLAQSAMPVVDVAVACGFVSASHFSKCYREIYHCSPQQERVQRKQERSIIHEEEAGIRLALQN